MNISNQLLILFTLWINVGLLAQYNGDQIFDNSYIHTIEIDAELNLQDITDIYYDELLSDDYTYSLASVLIDGNSLDSAGVRVKGGISAFDPKKPLKLDFNKFTNGQKYDGLKKLNLHQGNMDPSFIRETLAYDLFRNSGVKTVRTAFAKVYFNGTYEGLYTLVEQVDDTFINEMFADDDGALYKTGFGGVRPKYQVDSSFTFEQLQDAINQIPAANLEMELHQYIDLESFYKMMAHEIFLGNNDGPFQANDNYYIYYEPKSQQYTYVPWDYNIVLYGAKHSILDDSGNFIFERMKENANLETDYLITFCRLLEYHFDLENINDRIDSYGALISDEVSNDPYFTNHNLIEEINFIKSFIAERKEELELELTQLQVSCEETSNPLDDQSISINEIVASSNAESNIFDPQGGYPDWIELYNNTDSEINLHNLYLSNDSDFLKHWRFEDGMTLQPDAYQIIWADRDVDEEGSHADFKLNKDLGELYLSTEDGTIIDSVAYTNQTTNISYARVPNGLGDFMMQTSTFATNNDDISSIDEELAFKSLEIYPNPAQNRLYVKDGQEYSNAICKVTSLDGKLMLSATLTSQGIDISELESGVYHLTLRGETLYQTKFIVE